jgi:hypothetical protein
MLGLLLIVGLLGASLLATTAGAADAYSFDIALTGAAEIPGPGDPDGSGSASLTVYPDLGIICYTLQVSGIAKATAAHVHVIASTIGVEGFPEGAGPVAIPLKAPKKGFSTDCKEADPAILANIVANPSHYYVNVHNAPFPAGAVRGNLPG